MLLDKELEFLKRFMPKLREKLCSELVELRKALKEKHHTLKSLCDDDYYMNRLHNAMWEACIRDALIAGTWMQLFFGGSVSGSEEKKHFIY